jgi:hypothetical protein
VQDNGGGKIKVMGKAGKKTVIVIVVVAVVLAGIALYARWTARQSAPQSTGPAPVYAPKGQMVAGFPTDLILDHNVQAMNSYTINYSTSTHLYVAQWNSSGSVASLYNAYLAYLPAHGWTITNRFTSRPDLRGLYVVKNATSSPASANITITVLGRGSQVSIGYALGQ